MIALTKRLVHGNGAARVGSGQPAEQMVEGPVLQHHQDYKVVDGP
jgi:hypothetical protein